MSDQGRVSVVGLWTKVFNVNIHPIVRSSTLFTALFIWVRLVMLNLCFIVKVLICTCYFINWQAPSTWIETTKRRNDRTQIKWSIVFAKRYHTCYIKHQSIWSWMVAVIATLRQLKIVDLVYFFNVIPKCLCYTCFSTTS